jgi:hypothetical protein
MAGMSERVRNNLLKYGDKSKWESWVPIWASTGTLGSDWVFSNLHIVGLCFMGGVNALFSVTARVETRSLQVIDCSTILVSLSSHSLLSFSR